MTSIPPSAPAAGDTGDTPRPGASPAAEETDTMWEPAPAPPPQPSWRQRRKQRRANKVTHWDRPPPPIDWRWWVGNTGRVLITVGVLMFGFVAYQLWGTAIETARAQNSLENDFEEMLAEVEPIATPTTVAEPVTGDDEGSAAGSATDGAGDDTAAGDEAANGGNKKNNKNRQATAEAVEETPESTAPVAVPVADQNIPDISEGDALARLEIPRIGTDHIVVAGVSTGDLKKGPGHYPDTPIPGQLGNAAIAGHRTTYGQPFYSINELEVGDEIHVTTLSGRFTYRVTGQEIVGPSDYEVVATTDPTVANLTLTSCHPRWTAQERIVIYSELASESSAPVGEPTLNYGRAPEEPAAEESPDDAPGRDNPVVAGDEQPDGTGDQSGPSDDGDDTAPAVDDGDDTAPAVDDEDASGDTAGTTSAAAAADTTAIADAFAEGWFSDPGAPLHVALWALVLAAIAICGYLIARRFRRDWLGILVAFLPFLVALYFFYQNVNRLLPPNL